MINGFFKKQIVKNSFYNLLGHSIVIVVSTIFIMLISRKLTKYEFGIFAVMNIFMTIVPMIVGLGLPTSAIRLVPELMSKGEKEKVSDIIKLTILLPIPETVLILFIGVIFSKFLSQIFLKSVDYYQHMVWILFTAFFYSIIDRIILVYQSLQKFKNIAFLSIFVNTFSRILAFLFLLGSCGLIGIFYGFLVSEVIGVIYGFYTLRKYIFSKYNGYLAKEYLRFSFPYYLKGWARFGFNQADQTIVALVFTPEVLAVYFVAKKIISTLILVLSSFLDVLIPKLAENKGYGMEFFIENYKKVNKMFIMWVLLSVLFVSINSKFLMYLLAGVKFHNQFLILNILSISLFFYFMFTLYSVYIYLCYLPSETLKLNLLAGIINIISGVVLGLKFGLKGFAVAQSIGFIYSLYFIYNKYREITNFNFLSRDIGYVIIAILGVVIGHFFNSYFLNQNYDFITSLKVLSINVIFLFIILLLSHKFFKYKF